MKIFSSVFYFLVLSAACGASGFDVYFGTGGGEARGIYRSSFDAESGELSPASLAAEIGSPGFLALHPDGDTLYAVANDGAPCVASYRISRDDGSLALLNTEPIGDGGGAHIAVHPSGEFLLTAQYGAGSVAVFPIEANGEVGPLAQRVQHEGGSGVVPARQKRPHPHWVGFAPDGRFAFVPDLGLDQIVVYRIDAQRLRLERHGVAESVPGGGPRHMRFSVDGRFIYLLNELTLSVTSFAYDAASGETRRLSTTPTLGDAAKAREAFNSASEILVHPAGRFVYAANRGHDSVTVLHADPSSGALTAQAVEPVRGAFPRNINLDPSGNWLLAAGQHSGTVAVFAVDGEDGGLQFQTGKVINVPSPICILFSDRDR